MYNIFPIVPRYLPFTNQRVWRCPNQSYHNFTPWEKTSTSKRHAEMKAIHGIRDFLFIATRFSLSSLNESGKKSL